LFFFFVWKFFFFDEILASNDLPDENPRKIELIHNQNQTIKPIKQDPIEPQRIARPDTPDSGKFKPWLNKFFRIIYLLGCEIDEKCSDDAIPYKIISGDGIEKYPIICFNNKL
jgi:hypothetical protein